MTGSKISKVKNSATSKNHIVSRNKNSRSYGVSKNSIKKDRRKTNEETRRRITEIDSLLRDLREGNSESPLSSISLVLGKVGKAEVVKQVDANSHNYPSHYTKQQCHQNSIICPQALIEETIKDFVEKL